MSAAVQAPLILYSARVCPWAQRATLALQETQLPHRITEIDLQAKPEWYDSKINPASKVPVLQVGGTDENSTGVPRIPESGVLLELISDLGEARGTRSLKPKDVIETAEARYFIERYLQVVQGPIMAVMYHGDTSKAPEIVKGIEEIQKHLEARRNAHGGPFWHGKEPGLADLGIAPFVGRLRLFAKDGGLEAFSSSETLQKLYTDDKYRIYRDYGDALVSRESWKNTFDDDYVLSYTKRRLEQMRQAAAK